MFYRKSNALIYSMDNGSLLAHQLFAIGMSVAYVDEDGRVNSVVCGSDIKKFLSLKSNSIYKKIRELCDKDSKESVFKWQVSIKDDVKDQYEIQNSGVGKEESAGDFDKSIVSKAVNEINEKTSLNVEYTPVEEGNIVGGVEFRVPRKESGMSFSLGENSMYAIAERDKDICVGTVSHEPSPFLYLVLVMGICNINEKEELLSSTVTAEDIAQALNMKMEDVCNEMKAISNRSVDRASIYDWMTRKEVIPGKRVLEQIVTDAVYSDGIITMKYNHSLNKYLVRLKEYYTVQIKDLIVDVRNEIKN